MRKLLVAAVSLTAAACVQAQVQVVESVPQAPSQAAVYAAPQATAQMVGQPISSSSEQSTAQVGSVAAQPKTLNPQAEIFYQLQTLQQEVLELRGLVEEQTYNIKRLKQQRLDDYVDLDRRIVALGGHAKAPGNNSSGVNGSGSAVSGASHGSDKQDYDQALALLRKRDITSSIQAFKQHLNNYPGSPYSANVHYWLGETYLLQGDLELARQSFALLIETYPKSRKLLDARYKLGTVYFQQGDKSKAKILLKEVANGTGSAATLAEKYLQKNFQSI